MQKNSLLVKIAGFCNWQVYQIMNSLSNYLTAILLLKGQLWAIIKGTVSLNQCQSLRFCFQLEGHQEACSEVGYLSKTLLKHTEHLFGRTPASTTPVLYKD